MKKYETTGNGKEIDQGQDKTCQNITCTEDGESYTKSTTGSRDSESINENVVKVQGVKRNTVSDQFFFDLGELYEYAELPPTTKRSIIKFTAEIFDPLGFLTSDTVVMKILFQRLCVDKTQWDD